MDWRFKAILQAILSRLPAGEELNYLFQRHVTHTFPLSDERFQGVLGTARQHLENLGRHVERPLEQRVFFEFGAGWDLLIPLAYHALGVGRQILVDIRPLVRTDLVNDVIEKFGRIPPSFPLLRTPAVPLPPGPEGLRVLRDCYGIDYRAPCDARNTGLEEGSIDCITSTNTLNHIPEEEVRGILRECRRLLSRGGAASFLIDYQDNYSYFDAGISAYNFLRYSSRTWSLYSPALHYQNRLRHRDFVALCSEAGLEVLEARIREGSAQDLALLGSLDLHAMYRGIPLPDLAARGSWMTLRRLPDPYPFRGASGGPCGAGPGV